MNKFLVGLVASTMVVLAGIATPVVAAYETNFTSKPWKLDQKYQRTEISYRTTEKPGTIIISTRKRFLYLIQDDDRAIRYGIGVGRQGFTWTGAERISRKAEWPDWIPPAEMRERDPDIPTFMKGGPDNPLGARALYLGATEYRIHGTAQPWTIGRAVSSGCIRLQNDDIIDLYSRVKIGSKVIVQ
jgi:lipoprotein-anchoring transpeptidase ErfK/SrfK